MKRSTLMKLATMFLAMFLIVGAKAQTNTGQWGGTATVGDYVQSAAAPITTEPGAGPYTYKVTIGKTIPFFVWPSAAYNPNWNPGNIGAYELPANDITTNVTSNFVWKYAASGSDWANDLVTIPVAGFTKNYVEIAFPTAGDIVVRTQETPASGICPALPVYFGVRVINLPSFTITSASALGLTRVIKSGCWSGLNTNQTQIPFVNNNTEEVYPYHFDVTYTIYNVNGLNASGNLPADGSGDLDIASPLVVTPALAYDSKINGVVAGAPSDVNPIVVTSPNTNLLSSNTDFEAKSSKITVYELTVNGYNAKISRTSDYVTMRGTTANKALYESYAYHGTSTKYYIIALPTPVTGPIYHIATTWSI